MDQVHKPSDSERYTPSSEWVDVMTDGQSAYPSCVGHPFAARDQILLFPFLCRKIALLFNFGRPLWREDGSVICRDYGESILTRLHTGYQRRAQTGRI
jgi:hypothetical protein